MGNGTNQFDFTNSLDTFLAQPVSNGTWSDILETLKFDKAGQGAQATDVAAFAGQLWSNLLDDYILATYDGGFYLKTHIWRLADLTALQGLGSDDGLAVDDLGYTEDENRTYFVTSVVGPSSSTWEEVPVRKRPEWNVVASETLGAANINDFSPASPYPDIQVLRLTPFAGGTTLTGLVGPSPAVGQRLILCNVSTVDSITLTYNDGSSTGANRFLIENNASRVILRNGTVELWYDIQDLRWRVF